MQIFLQFKGSLAGGVASQTIELGREATLLGYQSSIGAVLSTDPNDSFQAVTSPSTDDRNEGMIAFMNSGFYYQVYLKVPNQKIFLNPDQTSGGNGFVQLIFDDE